ncbi:MAG TPA: EVE domain-containing protein [Bacteroidetes bacterium]|nr:EVE domain-containing protein [Bacteroidota bacterium]
MNYWLVKSDPETYGWKEIIADKKTDWTGVRSYAARNHLRGMKKGDQVLFYHSNKDTAVVGIVKVTKEFFQDPTTDEDAWVAVELSPLKAFKKMVTLNEIKKEKSLSNIGLIKIGRLSVMPVTENEFSKIIEMGGMK